MTLPSSLLVIAFAVLVALPAAAQTPGASGGSSAQAAAEKARQHERAVERCRQNRGIDCATPEGLKEWELLERSREEAIREGSRSLRPALPVAPKTVQPAATKPTTSSSAH